ncbi:lytic transglycosylase domain-containing protein [Mesorhizobium sp. A623]
MYKLTGVTAALAAGVMSFAVTVAHSAPPNFRTDQGAIPAQAHKTKAADAKKTGDKTTKQKVAKKTGTKTAKAAAKRKAARKKTAIDRTTTASIGPVNAAKSAKAAVPYSAIVARYAASYGVPFSLARAVIRVESNYRPHLTGSAGEVGLMQIKPATARMMGYSGSVKGLYDPETNIKYGMKYLAMAQGLGGGTTCGTILKYNAGHAAKRMNPVSSAYCSKVKVHMARLGTSI